MFLIISKERELDYFSWVKTVPGGQQNKQSTKPTESIKNSSRQMKKYDISLKIAECIAK